MKIAVVGEGPVALETALFFIKQDCSVSLFGGDQHVDSYFKRYLRLNEQIETSKLGRERLSDDRELLNVEKYKTDYFLFCGKSYHIQVSSENVRSIELQKRIYLQMKKLKASRG